WKMRRENRLLRMEKEILGKAAAFFATEIHAMSRRSYGSPRVHAELRLGEGIAVGRKRVERLMRAAGLAGIHKRRYRGCTRRDPDAQPSDDLVNRHVAVEGPDRLWVTDVTEHLTGEGKLDGRWCS